MHTLETSTETIDYEAFINKYLYGSLYEAGEFEVNDKREDCIMPSVSHNFMNDFIQDKLIDIKEALCEPDEEGYSHYSGAGNVGIIYLESVYIDGADTAVEWLQDDLHEIFPNEKVWPHLDALAETAAREYYKQLEITMHDYAIYVLSY